MPTTKSNLTQTPVNADTFNLTGDLGTMAESITSVVSVANQAAGDAVATARAAAGFAVTDARPLFCWDQSQNAIIVKGTAGWRGGVKPFGHMGKTDTFQAVPTVTPAIVTMAAAQTLRGGMTFDNPNDALVVPIAGYYRITLQFYSTGSGSGTQLGFAYVNGGQIGVTTRHYKNANDDTQSCAYGVYQLAAGDKVSMYCLGTASVSTWGSAAYNGDYVEVEYMDQW